MIIIAKSNHHKLMYYTYIPIVKSIIEYQIPEVWEKIIHVEV